MIKYAFSKYISLLMDQYPNAAKITIDKYTPKGVTIKAATAIRILNRICSHFSLSDSGLWNRYAIKLIKNNAPKIIVSQTITPIATQ